VPQQFPDRGADERRAGAQPGQLGANAAQVTTSWIQLIVK
jgi:hypothetical protein